MQPNQCLRINDQETFLFPWRKAGAKEIKRYWDRKCGAEPGIGGDRFLVNTKHQTFPTADADRLLAFWVVYLAFHILYLEFEILYLGIVFCRDRFLVLNTKHQTLPTADAS